MRIPSINTFADARHAVGLLAREVDALRRWRFVPKQAGFDPAAVSSSQLAMATSGLAAGLPLRYMQRGQVYYALVNAVGSNLVTIAGAPLSTSDPIEALWIGRPELAIVERFWGPGEYGTSTGSFADKFKQRRTWGRGTGYAVKLSYLHEVNATTTNPRVNLSIGANHVLTSHSGNGVNPAAGTWNGSGVDVDTSKYQITFGDRFTLSVLAADSGATKAQDFSGYATFVLE